MPVHFLPSRHSLQRGASSTETVQTGRILSLASRLPRTDAPGAEGAACWVTESGKQYAYSPAPVLQLPPGRHADDVARRYLKLVLPAIPITAFVLTFLYAYLLVGISAAQSPASQAGNGVVVNPLLPLIGALLLASATGMICLIAYLGYQRVLDHARSHTRERDDAAPTMSSRSQL